MLYERGKVVSAGSEESALWITTCCPETYLILTAKISVDLLITERSQTSPSCQCCPDCLCVIFPERGGWTGVRGQADPTYCLWAGKGRLELTGQADWGTRNRFHSDQRRLSHNVLGRRWLWKENVDVRDRAGDGSGWWESWTDDQWANKWQRVSKNPTRKLERQLEK